MQVKKISCGVSTGGVGANSTLSKEHDNKICSELRNLNHSRFLLSSFFQKNQKGTAKRERGKDNKSGW